MDESTEKRVLAWGERPWDGMTRDELLREVRRYHAALSVAHGILWERQHESSPEDLYWRKGRGARVVEMCRQVMARLSSFEPENLYRVFFRFAPDLLFEDRPPLYLGFGSAVCDRCGTMLGRGATDRTEAGRVCDFLKDAAPCGGTYTPLEWRDLAPQGAA